MKNKNNLHLEKSCSRNKHIAKFFSKFLGVQFFVIIFLCFAVVISADLTFVPPTPGNATSTPNASIQINISISMDNLSSVIWNWNGNNFTIYNDSLVLMLNFDNLTGVGESSSANFIADASRYNNSVNCSGMGTGCNWTTGRYGKALNFDGVDDYGYILFNNAFNMSRAVNPDEWSKYNSEVQVLIKGVAGEWDEDGSTFATFMNDSGEIKSWYHGWNDTSSYIGFANSSTGLSFAKPFNQPIFAPDLVTEKDYRVPMVWKEGSLYHMIYTYRNIAGSYFVGHANSTDNLNWTKDVNNPIFNYTQASTALSGATSFENCFGIMKVGNMYYFTFSSWGNREVGIANSTNLSHFEVNRASPVFASNGDVNSKFVSRFCPHLFQSNGVYYALVPTYDGSLDYTWLILYNDSNPAFTNPQYVRTAVTPNINLYSGNYTSDLDTPWVLTDITNIERNVSNFTNLLVYYATTKTNAGWGVSLINETKSTALTQGSYSWMNSSAMTISTWVKINSNASSVVDSILTKGNIDYFLGLYPNSCKLAFGDAYGYRYTNIDYCDNNWHNVIARHDGTNLQGGLTIFIDGVNVSNSFQGVFNGFLSASSNSGLGIGAASTGASRFFNGTIDEIRFYNRSLSDAEIYESYASNLQKFNSTQYYLYINQSKNAISGLDSGTYNYSVYVKDSANNFNSTEIRQISVNITIYPTNVSNCMILDSANTYYQLNASISNNTVTAACINVTASNVILDCQGYFISSTQNFTGIYSNQLNTTIKNCNISMGQGNNTKSIGIELTDGADNSNIINNTIWDNGVNGMYYGISTAAENQNISDNNVNVSNNAGCVGIVLTTSNNNTLRGNNAISKSSYGIWLTGASNNTLINNIGISNSSYAIYLSGGSATNNNILINNTGNGVSVGSVGILLTANNNILINNTGNCTSNVGIWLSIASNNNLTGNTGISVSGYPFYLSNAHNNILINNTGATSGAGIGILLQNSLNNTLISHNATSNSAKAVYLSNGDKNIFYNQIAINRVSGFQTNGIYMDTNSDNNIFQDCINITGIAGDVLLTGTSVNNTFINCSYRTTGTNENIAAGSWLRRKWYYRAYANNSVGNPVNNVNVSAYNISGILQFAELTNTSGWTNITTITDYVNTGGTRNYYNNYTISTDTLPYSIGEQNFSRNITDNLISDILILTYDLTSPNATLLTPTNNSYKNTDQNFSVNLTDNIGLKNATLHIFNSTDNEVNTTVFTSISGTLESAIGVVVTLVDGVYKWFYEVFDLAGNQFIIQNNTVIIDTTPSYFTAIPNGISQSHSQSFNVTFNATDGIAFGYYSINWTDTFAINQSGYLNNTGTLEVGNYYINVTINDTAGNKNSTIFNINITSSLTPSCGDGTCNNGETCSTCPRDCGQCQSSSGSGIWISSFWESTYINNYKDLKGLPPFLQSLGEKQRVKILVDSEIHYVGVTDIINDKVIVNVSSDNSKQAILKPGETAKFDVNDDSYYDIQVLLNNIYKVLKTNKANLTISYIHEKMLDDLIINNQTESIVQNSINNNSTISIADKNNFGKCGIGKGRNFGVCIKNIAGYFALLFVMLLIIMVIWAMYKKPKKRKCYKS